MNNATQARALEARHSSVESGWRIRAHDLPRIGMVLEAELYGRQDPGFWDGVREAIREEVARRPPQYLVFDLRALDCIVGSAFLGGLVAGAVEMESLGKPGRTKIVAAGKIARRLTEILPLCKLEPILGVIHPDLESALAPQKTDSSGRGC